MNLKTKNAVLRELASRIARQERRVVSSSVVLRRTAPAVTAYRR